MTPCILHGGGRKYASREAYIEARGPIPKGMVVRHTCDNERCVNVDHLLLGTQAQNIADKVARGRQAKGKACQPRSTTKLTEADVHAIRAVQGLLSVRDLASIFGVSAAQISQVQTWRSWGWLL